MTDKAKREPTDAGIAARAMACKGWRWMPGMAGHTPSRCTIRIIDVAYSEDQERRGVPAKLSEKPNGEPITYVIDGDILRDCDGEWDTEGTGALPDPDDPATLGCIEHGLLPEAWGPGTMVDRESWITTSGTRRFEVSVRLSVGHGDTCRDFASDVGFGDALVAALEAAP